MWIIVKTSPPFSVISNLVISVTFLGNLQFRSGGSKPRHVEQDTFGKALLAQMVRAIVSYREIGGLSLG